jgi:hypothetical protein
MAATRFWVEPPDQGCVSVRLVVETVNDVGVVATAGTR